MAEVLHSSARAVGQGMRRNPFAPTVPCHRVISADRRLGGFYGAWVGAGMTCVHMCCGMLGRYLGSGFSHGREQQDENIDDSSGMQRAAQASIAHVQLCPLPIHAAVCHLQGEDHEQVKRKRRMLEEEGVKFDGHQVCLLVIFTTSHASTRRWYCSMNVRARLQCPLLAGGCSHVQLRCLRPTHFRCQLTMCVCRSARLVYWAQASCAGCTRHECMAARGRA